MGNLGEAVRRLREHPDTEAVGSKWTPEEDARLVDALRENTRTIDDIARDHKRTPGGISSRMRHIAIEMIESQGKTVGEVCDLLHMSEGDIEEAQKRRAAAKDTQKLRADAAAKDTRKLRADAATETDLDVLKDIRKLLVRIEAKLL